jgi:hypothetical protein
MMEVFKAEGLAYPGRRTAAVQAHDALASIQKRLDGESLIAGPQAWFRLAVFTADLVESTAASVQRGALPLLRFCTATNPITVAKAWEARLSNFVLILFEEWSLLGPLSCPIRQQSVNMLYVRRLRGCGLQSGAFGIKAQFVVSVLEGKRLRS